MIWTILLIILGIIVFIGTIRLIISPADSLLEFFGQLFLIDLLGDLLEMIFHSIDD